jgi:hypothetical protein
MEANPLLSIVLAIDNMAVFKSVSGFEVVCNDLSMRLHALQLRHYLDRLIVDPLLWIDTRDMLADALTKGKIRRDAINDAFNNGRWTLQHLKDIVAYPKRAT